MYNNVILRAALIVLYIYSHEKRSSSTCQLFQQLPFANKNRARAAIFVHGEKMLGLEFFCSCFKRPLPL